MSSSPAVPDPQHLRASDADRERVAETLRAAAGDGRLTMDELDERLDAVYAAKTYAELVPITQDLPDHSGAASVPSLSRPAAGDVRQYGGEATSHTAVAILGGFSRKGDWVVPKTFNAFMLLGGGELDLSNARFTEREVSIHVVAILGGCEITVPEDATVHVNGVGILGAFEHSQPGRTGDQHQRGRLARRRRRHPQAPEEVQARQARGQSPGRTRLTRPGANTT
jgi:hypothetical protein